MTPSIYKMVGSGAVTQANMRISAVAGTAFVDFSDSEAAANKLINHKGYLLKVRDSSKRAIQGYVKAAGTGETLVELMDDLSFDNDTKWTITSGWTVNNAGNSKAVATAATGGNNLTQLHVGTSGKLYKAILICDSYTSGQYAIRIANTTHTPQYSETGTKAWYKTGTVTATVEWGISSYVALTASFTDISINQVTTPSATGVTITSTKGGSTFNFAALDSAFNYNDASGYTYELWAVNNAVEVASGSIAAGEMLADTTATNAFVAPVGVDLSAYQTGKYIFAAYNTVGGYAAFGYIKGTAPGGETLEAELCTAWHNHVTFSYDTFASVAGNITSAISLTNKATRGATDTDSFGLITNGELYKYVVDITQVSGQTPNVHSMDSPAQNTWGSFGSLADATRYLTAPDTGTKTSISIGGNLATNFGSTFSFKHMTDCAATGALIVSAKDGATRAFSYIHPSFSANAASTWKCFYVGD